MAHRMPRNTGGHSPANIAHLCHACHRWCHDNPAAARRAGWIVWANSALQPVDLDVIPARTRNGWVRFSHSGQKYPMREQYAHDVIAMIGVLPAEVTA